MLLGTAVAVVLVLQRLHVPTILAYLLVGVLVGPHTPGPIIDAAPLRPLAEFGIVFLLFTIGLSFSLPQLHALRHLVLGLGTAQVVLTTAVVGVAAALAVLRHVRALRPDLPVMVRTRDETHVDALREAGATEVVSETLEAGLMIATHALLLLDVPLARVVRRFQGQRASRYRLLREFFRGGEAFAGGAFDGNGNRMTLVVVPAGTAAAGRTLADLRLNGVVVTALVRWGKRLPAPPPQTRIEAGDALVLFGAAQEVDAAERMLLG